MDDQLNSWLGLSLLRLSTRQVRLLQDNFELTSVLSDEPALRARLLQIQYDFSSYIQAVERSRQANALLEQFGKIGWSVIPQYSDAYPQSLFALTDPPLSLFIRGDERLLIQPQVALVGSRAATPLGKEIASRLAGDLSKAGVTVTSGLALGIDAAAHQGALKGVGNTIAVMATGPDRIYPRVHCRLADQIVACGGLLLTEKLPGLAPKPYLFPERNRIISALSLATVVVEADLKSGSLITARMALEQGREVMAVPGSLINSTTQGCHRLIKEGASLVESAQDILMLLHRPLRAQIDLSKDEEAVEMPPYDPVLESLKSQSLTIDQIALQTGWKMQKLLPHLTHLELQGVLVRHGAKIVRIR